MSNTDGEEWIFREGTFVEKIRNFSAQIKQRKFCAEDQRNQGREGTFWQHEKAARYHPWRDQLGNLKAKAVTIRSFEEKQSTKHLRIDLSYF